MGSTSLASILAVVYGFLYWVYRQVKSRLDAYRVEQEKTQAATKDLTIQLESLRAAVKKMSEDIELVHNQASVSSEQSTDTEKKLQQLDEKMNENLHRIYRKILDHAERLPKKDTSSSPPPQQSN